MRTATAAKADEKDPMIKLKEKSGEKEMASFRLPSKLLRRLEEIAKKENVAKVQLLEGWIRAGIADYEVNGVEKI